jgi:L-seryl-tRNA(Ser) seleniumtransferase
MLVITPLTPSKHHMPAEDVRRAVTIAKDAGMLVFCDDAHMMSRCDFYDEPATFALGDIDVAVWSIDKHVPGPRGAAIVAHRDLMEAIQAKAFQFGLEAQSGHYVAMLRGIEALDTGPIEDAGQLAREAFRRFQNRYGDRVYQAGPGVAFSAEDFAHIVQERADGGETFLVPGEVSIAGCFVLMRDYGVVTIPITGYPGAAPTFRLMMHPDGARFGLDRLEEALEATIDATAGLLHEPEDVRRLLLGED